VTTTFFLVRHAAHDNVGGFLAGRTPGIVLGPAGLAQAERLGARMSRETFAAIYASPRERTQQTAAAISSASGVGPVQTAEELDEIDFGDWSNKTFDVLNTDPLWRQWNTVRSVTRTPGGETVLDVQGRVLRLMERLGKQFADQAVVLVTHADIIKSALSYHLGLPFDAWPRFEISPASISTVVVGDWGARVHGINEVIW